MKEIKFERMLAKRYIAAQKRHSVLTVCSIVIAVALMTMFFTGYTTMSGIMRAVHYDKAPYHMEFRDVTAKQAQYLSELPEVGEFDKLVNDEKQNSYTVRLLFDKYIDDDAEYLRRINEEGSLGIEIPFLFSSGHSLSTPQFENNQSLMQDDRVTLAGRASAVTAIAIMFIFVLFVAMALRLIIDTAFEVSSKERERQFGVLQSIGATPKQIVRILTHEGMLLSVIGVPLGAAAGIGLALLFAGRERARHRARLRCIPLHSDQRHRRPVLHCTKGCGDCALSCQPAARARCSHHRRGLGLALRLRHRHAHHQNVADSGDQQPQQHREKGEEAQSARPVLRLEGQNGLAQCAPPEEALRHHGAFSHDLADAVLNRLHCHRLVHGSRDSGGPRMGCFRLAQYRHDR